MQRRATVAIPSGAIYPDGLPLTHANADIQRSVRPQGQVFVSSVGFATIRPGTNRYQDPHGAGIHFTPLRFAEDVSIPGTLPLMVDVTTAPDHADIADLPGSADLNGVGQVSNQEQRIYASESNKMAPTGGAVRHRGSQTLPDMGDREAHRPLSNVFHGLANPVDAFKAEYTKNPAVALLAAAGLTGIVYMIARDFERSYRTRSRSATSGGGVVSNAAPVAVAPAAAVDTTGNTVEKVADTTVAAVESVADATGAVVETAAEAVEKVTETAADAVTA